MRYTITIAAALLAGGLFSQPADAHRGCHTHRCKARVATAHKWNVVAPYNSKLNRMAQCESGGRWHIATGNGFYGGLQFTIQSWFAAGGRGMPNLASILEQKYRAIRLMWLQGWGAWPICSYR